jgi:hypothetical protein
MVVVFIMRTRGMGCGEMGMEGGSCGVGGGVFGDRMMV